MKLYRIYLRRIYTQTFVSIHKEISKHIWEISCIVGLIVIHILFLGNSVEFNLANIINGGDTLQLLDPELFIRRSLSVWQETGTGLSEPIPGYWIFYAIPLYLLNKILININISTFIFFVSLFSLSSISMFLLSNEITDGCGLSFFTSIFYSINLYTAIEFHAPVVHILYLFGVTPLLVLIFIKLESSVNYRKKLFYLLIYLFLYLPLVRTINMFIFYMFFIPLIGFILNLRNEFPFKKFLNFFILISFIIILVASPSLFPFFSSLNNLMTPITILFTRSAVRVALGQKLSDSMRFIWTYAWDICFSNEKFGGILTYSFKLPYQRNIILNLISFYPICIVFILFLYYYPKLQRLDKYKILGLLLLVIFNLFLITPSLTAIGDLLYEKEIYIFRSAWKYFSIPYILCLSLMLVLLLKQLASGFKKLKLLVFLLLLLLIHSAYILPAIVIYGKTINQSWIVETPGEYFEIREFLKNQDEEFRILTLPLSMDWAGYTPCKWGYVGPDILYTLVDKPIINTFSNTIAPIEYLNLLNKISTDSPSEVLEECKKLNVKYIVLHNDVDLKNPYRTVSRSPESYAMVLDNSDSIKDKHVFGELILYELESYIPRISLIPVNTSGNSLSEKFLHSAYQPDIIKYIHFAENSTPITLEISEKEVINSFSLNITFAPEPKIITESDWQIINYVPIHTNLFKIAISPDDILYIFPYLKDAKYLSIVEPFNRMEEISTINLNLKNSIFSVYFNNLKIREEIIEPPSFLTTVKIGSDIIGLEKYVGKIYDLDFQINGENIISSQKLFSRYPDYVENEAVYKFHLIPDNIEWRKISPTKYIVKLDRSKTENGFFLIFLDTFNPQWKAYYVENGVSEEISDVNHIHAYDYANAWYLNRSGNFTIVLEYKVQKLYDMGLKISFSVFSILLSIMIIPDSKILKIKKFTSKVKEIIKLCYWLE